MTKSSEPGPLVGWTATAHLYEIGSIYHGAVTLMAEISIDRPVMVRPANKRLRKLMPGVSRVVNLCMTRESWAPLALAFAAAGCVVTEKRRER